MNCIAAIDCGTNSTRLLITTDAGEPIVRELRTTRLGEGVDAAHELSAAAQERTLSALQAFRALMDRNGVEVFRAVATSAVRDAANGQAFLDAAGLVLRGPVEVLAGEAEGALTFLGATARRPPNSYLVIDIGGGSTELVFGAQTVQAAVSLDIGCVRLSEQVFTGGPYSRQVIEAGRTLVDAQLATVNGPTGFGSHFVAIGVAGTITTLAALELKLETYQPGAVEGFRLTSAALTRRFDQLSSASTAQLDAQPGMPPGRAGVIVAGALILMSIMENLALKGCEVSEMDILDGVISGLGR